MFQIKNINYSIGERELLKDVSWVISPGVRAALIGPNGAGKTTLFRILIGELKHHSGDIFKPNDYRIGYLPQEEIRFKDKSVLDLVLEGNKEIFDLENKIQSLRQQLAADNQNQEQLLTRLGTLEHRYEILGGFSYESEARAILAGLGFQPDDFQRPLSEFSGGWRMRAYLARLLLLNPNLLLLDEPTNHLDLPSLEWLERYLMNFQGSMIIVSHDRYFIDRLCHEIYELERGELTHYPGDYKFYEQKKQEKLEQLQKQWEEQQAERGKQQRFIERFRYKASKASQVQSRRKMLEKMEKIEIPPPLPRLNFDISAEIQSYKDVLTVDDLYFRYDSDWIFAGLNLKIYRGERIALVGPNGIGKTTLSRLICKQLQPQKGTLEIGKRTQIGIYAQHQVDALNLDSTVYEEVAASASKRHVDRVRDVLGIFQFSGDAVNKKIDVLSGGEKARVSLAKLLISPNNFLIMDEPTNHLDIHSKEALENALKNYDGTLLIISHDRYFLDKLVSRVIEIKEKRIKCYEGNYSDYLKIRERHSEEKPQLQNRMVTKSPSKKVKDKKRLEAEARQSVSKKRNFLKNEIAELEAKIEFLEQRKEELEALLADPETYKDGMKTASMQKEYNGIQLELEKTYRDWEEHQLDLENLLDKLNKVIETVT